MNYYNDNLLRDAPDGWGKHIHISILSSRVTTPYIVDRYMECEIPVVLDTGCIQYFVVFGSDLVEPAIDAVWCKDEVRVPYLSEVSELLAGDWSYYLDKAFELLCLDRATVTVRLLGLLDPSSGDSTKDNQ